MARVGNLKGDAIKYMRHVNQVGGWNIATPSQAR